MSNWLKTTAVFILLSCLSSASVYAITAKPVVVATRDGRQAIFDYPKEKIEEGIRTGKLSIGLFKRKINDYSVQVIIDRKKYVAYIPEDIRGSFLQPLPINTPLLLQYNPRPLYDTEWDVMFIGAYTEETVFTATLANLTLATEEVITVARAQPSTAPTAPAPAAPAPSPAAAKTYYWVDPVNGSDSAGRDGSNEEPWQTITYALTQVTGSTLNLAAGTYDNTAPGIETFPLNMKTNVDIVGQGRGTTTISGDSSSRVITAEDVTDLDISAVTITNGKSTDGGGVFIENSSVDITDCTISGNIASGAGGGGGAIYITGTTGTKTITRCIVTGNSATGDAEGQGIKLVNTGSTVTATNNLVYSNTTDSGNGCGFYLSSSSPTIINCTIVSHTGGATPRGGIFMINGSNPTIRNCIFYGNGGGGIYESGTGDNEPAFLHNCDFSENTQGLYYDPGDDYYDSAGGVNAFVDNAVANIDTDPIFKALGSDHHLPATSPCVDAGTTTGAPSNDLDGDTRDDDPDIGCYEFQTGDDPPITGRVYDSVTGDNISSPVVAIYKEGIITPLSRTTSNPYTFNVDPGNYYIAVARSGYAFPSQIVSQVVTGDHGDVFTAEANVPLAIDIPMDPDGYLILTKTVNKERVTTGDIITYNIRVENRHWFKAIDNVVLIDQIVNGFKYVSDSTYLGNAQQSDPTVSGHTAQFSLGTVSANTTLNLNYQVRVSTGIPPGRYRASVYAQSSSSGDTISNTSNVSVEVIADPLFTTGTIIGKVFLDANRNGWQDPGEEGIPGVQIATEYGVLVETDDDGKYHIANVAAGNHLLKVEGQNADFTTENPYFVKITEGLLAKVNFGVILEREASASLLQDTGSESTGVAERSSAPANFFIVALAEGIVRNLDTSGNIEMMDKDDRFDDGFKVDGRLALYLKGKILGKFLVTASLDTDRLEERRTQRLTPDTKKLFTNLDPEKYYPIYGDASIIDYSATDTQDILYLLVEWGVESFAKWGSFHTDIPLYHRSLSGGNIVYKSVSKTKFDDPYTEIKGFYAIAHQLAAHDEFVGTGGSLFYLRHRHVAEGSEKVRVEIRERVSKTPVITIPLVEEKDYTIDYDTGKIILKKPLNLAHQPYVSSVISNDILAGERCYLVVDYEYIPGSGMSNESAGIRVSQWLGSHIRVGGTYVRENKDPDPYELKSGDATLKLNNDTYVNASYSRTDETQLGGAISYTGGLSFDERNATSSDGEHGNAFNIKGRTKLFGNTVIDLSYSRQDPHYNTTDSLTTQGTQKYVAKAVTQFTERLSGGVFHVTQKLLDSVTITGGLTGNTTTHTTTAFLDYNSAPVVSPSKWDWRVEYQHQEVSNPVTEFTYLGQRRFHDNDFVAARLGYEFNDRFHPYIRGQATLSGDTNNQGTIGADIKLWDTTSLNIAETVGNLGNSTLVGLIYKNADGTETYANIETGNNIHLGKYTRSTYGQSSKLSEHVRVYVEEDYSSYRENVIRGNLLGYEHKLSDTASLALTYERSFLEDDTDIVNRDSVSAALSYLNTDWLNLFTKLELRDDRNSDADLHERQWFTQNSLHWYITKDLSVLGKAEWSISEDKETDSELAEFYDIGVGLAYRPVKFDRLNLLAKYNYITDMAPGSQTDFLQTTESRRNIYAVEGVLDLFKPLQLVGKFALRDMSEKVGPRDWTDSETYLYIARTNFHITSKWDIAAEYRMLTNSDSDDSRSGWLLEVDRDIGKYIRVGAGYNFTDFDDDLSDSDDWDAGGWFVRVNGKY